MTKVIVKEGESEREIYNGQIRATENGRIVMVITDERYREYGRNTQTKRALVLQEGENGLCNPFTTVPKVYESDKEIVSRYPKVLSGTITIEEG